MITVIVYETESKKVVSKLTVTNEEAIGDNIKDGQSFIVGEIEVSRIKYATVIDGKVEYSKTEDEQDLEEKTADFRAARNAKLAESDWTQVEDSPLSDSKKTEWQTYRQQLRDMPQQEGFDPLNPTYPDEPS